MTFSNDKIITWHQMTHNDDMSLLLGLSVFFFRKPPVSPQATFGHHEAAVPPRLIFPRSPEEEKNLT